MKENTLELFIRYNLWIKCCNKIFKKEYGVVQCIWNLDKS